MSTARSDNRIRGVMIRDQGGQSLILALMVLFLLVFIGGVFVALIARNVMRTQRSGETLSVDYLADAGVRYASDQLTYSEDGADWRPVPSYPQVLLGLAQGWTLQDLEANLSPPTERPDPRDPDYLWLMQGFCRFTYGKGRFLLRVTYDPKAYDPISKYIGIESIGRLGIVDINDPTTWQTGQSSRLRAERVAYKAIAITDYARFITNKDRRSGSFSLGVPLTFTDLDGSGQAVVTPFVSQYGVWNDLNGDSGVDLPEVTHSGNKVTTAVEAHGGSIRVNGDLLWHGRNYIWLDPLRNEGVEVAGDILHDVYSTQEPLPPDATAVAVNLFGTRPSSDSFNTIPIPIRVDGLDVPPDAGVYRDGRTGTDANGMARGIVRLEPPLLDVRGPAGGLSRYRELTRNSGEWKWSTDRGEWFNTGYYAWGDGLYINNRDDIQAETELSTLRTDWTNPGGSQFWVGPYYIPPGVIIILTPYDLDNDSEQRPDMILVHGDGSGEAKFNWYDENGNLLTPIGGQMIMPYPRNRVIFAEGNIRIKGTLPWNTQLTVVSGGTIYIEGNILKYPWENYPKTPDEQPLPDDAPRNSAIALLATNHVCVNTTQFFGPMAEGLMPVNWRPDLSSFTASMDHPLFFNFAFGADRTVKYVDAGGQELPTCIYVRHTSASDAYPCYVNLSINQAGVGANPNNPSDPWFGLYHFGLMPWSDAVPPPIPAREYIYPLGDLQAAGGDPNVSAEQKWPLWEHQVYTLNYLDNYEFYTDPGLYNLIGLRLDQNLTKADYLLSRVAVQPCDMRIEALLYAQNGSFFVIPGEWFNPDQNDTTGNTTYRGAQRRCIDPRWPFHGQPLDVQVTIYGGVSENIPAPVADVTTWAERWGWIPPMHGSSGEAEHVTVDYRSPLDPDDGEDAVDDGGVPVRQRGLTFAYDGSLSYPKMPNPTDPDDRRIDLPIRVDAYQRMLPIVPKLPVSPQTLYFGEPM